MTAIAAGLTTAAAWRGRHDLAPAGRVRLGLLLVAAVAFVPWAVYWGLVVP
ncbi:DUF4175 domain-containing protein [Nonomuraea diastatica]|uniref:DUF4175 domain-containing protein n=1 Tax=Nonomuraea diastatica TaxID=1848329 RepID=UPI00140C5651|nr:DUF4175 domain-containing protein [Nonomuraea diastatica]